MGKDKRGSSKNGVTRNIYLNVYDPTPFNNYLYWFDLGVFHSGIEVYGMEYGYGAHDYPSSGVFEVEPRLCPGFLFRQSVRIGSTTMPRSDFQNFIQDLASKYHGNSYHLISKNCNHFTEEVAMYLTGKPIPAWVNRLARLDGIQVSQVRHVQSQNRNTSSEDGSDSLVSSIIDDEEDLLLMAPRLSNFSSSSSSTSTSTSNSNAISNSISNSHSNANTNVNAKTNTNTNTNTFNKKKNTNTNTNTHTHTHTNTDTHTNTNTNLNSDSKSNSNTTSNLNANSISNFNSHFRSHSQPHSLSHLHLHSHSHTHSHSYIFNFRDKDQPPRLAKDIICSK